MKFELLEKVREFTVGIRKNITMRHVANLRLAANEMVTFVTDNDAEHDFTAKEWGYYTTPSINGRLLKQGFHTALVENKSGQIFVMTVRKDKLREFDDYVKSEEQTILEWLHKRELKNAV